MKKKLRVTSYKFQVKKIIIFSAFCLLPFAFCFSQTDPYWNGWINFSGTQKYYKIPVAQNGVYRIDSLTLAQAGITNVDPHRFQLFFRGQEQFIYINGEADGVFNKNDYIEFYGQKNDGSLDSIMYKGDLYKNPVRQPNPYYSLFNDTSAYFLTWNNSPHNRITLLAGDTIDPNSPTQSLYFLKQEIVEPHTNYYRGTFNAQNIDFPQYEETEGWSAIDFGQCNCASANYITTFNTSNTYSLSGAPTATVSFSLMGESNDANTYLNHVINVQCDGSSLNKSFNGYTLWDSTFTVPANFITAASTNVVFTATGNIATSRNTVPFVTMKFPHYPNLENQRYYEMYVPSDSHGQLQTYFEFSNDTLSSVCLYDFTNHVRIPITKNTSTHKYYSFVPNSPSGAEKFCVVKSEKQFLTVPSIKPVHGNGFFVNYTALSADSAFIIITNKILMGDNLNGAIGYENYRKNLSGGNHKVIVADIDDLCDEFGYGIPKFPFSIRHFVNYCLDKFTSLSFAPPQNLFLIGKSIEPDKMRNQYADPAGNPALNYANCLVPSIATPTCDNMLVAGINNDSLYSPVPIGRLPAINIAEVNTYLTKVKEYEHPIPNPDEWMKNTIFFAGGNNGDPNSLSTEQLLCGYVHDYADTIQKPSFGGHASTFCISSPSFSQTSVSDSIKGLINSGTSIFTYFGHSSANILEFNLLPPNQYANTNGKYPFFIAEGCLAGDIHQPASNGTSLSEIFTLSNQGTIAFLASSGPGTPPELDKFSNYFFQNICSKYYGLTVGKCIQKGFKSAETNQPSNIFMDAAILEMTLDGDPSIVIHAERLPDYKVTTPSVYFTPSYVSTALDSFTINIVIQNIGKATNDKVKTYIKRIFSDGTFATYSKTLPHIYYQDTLHIRIPVDPIHGPGLNNFEVHVDSGYVIPELSYMNNDLVGQSDAQVIIYSGDIIPVYPYKYAIVPKDTITLKANTANIFAGHGKYIFQIDTSEQFNSSKLKTQKVTITQGSVVKAPYNLWSPSHLIFSDLPDSTVYFWRVRRDTSDMKDFRWRESSFQYIHNIRGWGQSHFFQFMEGDKFQYLDTNRISRSFVFDYQNHSIAVSAFNLFNPHSGNAQVYFSFDGLLYYNESGINVTIPHILICVINPITGYIWDNTNSHGSTPPSPSNFGADGFEFYTSSSANQDTIIKFIQNIPCGSKVLIFTAGDHNLGDLLGGNSPHTNPGLVHAFESVGGTQFPNIQNNLQYVLIGRKCGTAIEKIGASLKDTVLLQDSVAVKRASGIIFSEIIGPASNWKTLHWRYISPEQNTNPSAAAYDSITVNIIGIKANGDTATLIKNIYTKYNTYNTYNLSSISAVTYPNLQLLAYGKDRMLKTPPQLKKWQIYYDGVPEVSLNPVKHYSFYKSPIQQGDSVKFSVAIENIGDYNMDSLWVDAWIIDANRNQYPASKKSTRLKKLFVDSFLVASASFPTANLPGGVNSLWMEGGIL